MMDAASVTLILSPHTPENHRLCDNLFYNVVACYIENLAEYQQLPINCEGSNLAT